MKKRMLGLLLALCMVLTLMPVSALADDIDTAEQASQTGAKGPSVQTQPKGIAIQAGEAHTHCLCGETHTGSAYYDTISHDNMTFETAWNHNDYLPSSEGTYYLTTDIVLNSKVVMDRVKGITICLNGHSITSNAADYAIDFEGTTITFTDCNEKPGSISAPNGTAIYARYGETGFGVIPAKVNLYNISIENCKTYGIYFSTSLSKDRNTLYMYNASIKKNGSNGIDASGSAGDGDKVTIVNSLITGNGGTGVRIGESSLLTMSGTTVSDNGSTGVSIGGIAGSTITDCTITDNKGGGLSISSDTVISGDTKISNNTNSYSSGGINIYGASVTIKDNVKITGNTSGRDEYNMGNTGGGVTGTDLTFRRGG